MYKRSVLASNQLVSSSEESNVSSEGFLSCEEHNGDLASTNLSVKEMPVNQDRNTLRAQKSFSCATVLAAGSAPAVVMPYASSFVPAAYFEKLEARRSKPPGSKIKKKGLTSTRCTQEETSHRFRDPAAERASDKLLRSREKCRQNCSKDKSEDSDSFFGISRSRVAGSNCTTKRASSPSFCVRDLTLFQTAKQPSVVTAPGFSVAYVPEKALGLKKHEPCMLHETKRSGSSPSTHRLGTPVRSAAFPVADEQAAALRGSASLNILEKTLRAASVSLRERGRTRLPLPPGVTKSFLTRENPPTLQKTVRREDTSRGPLAKQGREQRSSPQPAAAPCHSKLEVVLEKARALKRLGQQIPPPLVSAGNRSTASQHSSFASRPEISTRFSGTAKSRETPAGVARKSVTPTLREGSLQYRTRKKKGGEVHSTSLSSPSRKAEGTLDKVSCKTPERQEPPPVSSRRNSGAPETTICLVEIEQEEDPQPAKTTAVEQRSSSIGKNGRAERHSRQLSLCVLRETTASVVASPITLQQPTEVDERKPKQTEKEKNIKHHVQGGERNGLSVKKELSNPVVPEALTLARAKIPEKGATRSWRMNQFISQLSVATTRPDLLCAEFEKRVSASDRLQNRKSSGTPVSQRRVSGSSGPRCSSSGRSLQRSVFDPEGPICTTKPRKRSSIPSWVMTPSQLEMLAHLHTGLTPRGTVRECGIDNELASAAPHSRRQCRSRGETARPPSSTETDQSDEDDESVYGPKYAADVLGAVEERSLQKQQLIERHKKKLYAIRAKPRSTVTSTRPPPARRYEETEVVSELRTLLVQHYADAKHRNRKEKRAALAWTADHAEGDSERDAAIEELNCFSDEDIPSGSSTGPEP